MQLVLEFLALPFVQDVLKILFILLLFAMPLGTFMTLMERKWSAAVQDRIGPNRANIGSYRGRGLLHIAADALKSIFKEDLIPKGADKFLYTIAPFFSFMSAVVVLPSSQSLAQLVTSSFRSPTYSPGYSSYLQSHPWVSTALCWQEHLPTASLLSLVEHGLQPK